MKYSERQLFSCIQSDIYNTVSFTVDVLAADCVCVCVCVCVCLFVLYGYHNKWWLFPQTALAG